MLFKLSNLNSNLALTPGYLNPALNNSAQRHTHKKTSWKSQGEYLNQFYWTVKRLDFFYPE